MGEKSVRHGAHRGEVLEEFVERISRFEIIVERLAFSSFVECIPDRKVVWLTSPLEPRAVLTLCGRHHAGRLQATVRPLEVVVRLCPFYFVSQCMTFRRNCGFCLAITAFIPMGFLSGPDN